jgi:hypothetical protein
MTLITTMGFAMSRRTAELEVLWLETVSVSCKQKKNPCATSYRCTLVSTKTKMNFMLAIPHACLPPKRNRRKKHLSKVRVLCATCFNNFRDRQTHGRVGGDVIEHSELELSNLEFLQSHTLVPAYVMNKQINKTKYNIFFFEISSIPGATQVNEFRDRQTHG